jgi:hypothetical protein
MQVQFFPQSIYKIKQFLLELGLGFLQLLERIDKSAMHAFRRHFLLLNYKLNRSQRIL